jgi:hypothetical protein
VSSLTSRAGDVRASKKRGGKGGAVAENSAEMDKLENMTIRKFEMLSMEQNSSIPFVYIESNRSAILDLAKQNTKHSAES